MRPTVPNDLARPLTLTFALALLAPLAVHGQKVVVPTIDACYVTATGNVYRIDTPTSPTPGAPKACTPGSVEFAWNQQGVQGEPGSVAEFTRELATAPVVQIGNRLNVRGVVQAGGGLFGGESPTPVPSGAGSRFMWIPQKSAIRAGQAAAGEWDEGNVGVSSAAFGTRALASGVGSFAAGSDVAARADGAVALGLSTSAVSEASIALGIASVSMGRASIAIGERAGTGGQYAIAMGQSATAMGYGAIALGTGARADGDYAVALGQAALARRGSFVYGDASTSDRVTAEGANQFVVRAAGGVRLRTSSDLAKGCDIDGEGRLACTGGVSAGAGTIQRVVDTWVPLRGGETVERMAACPTGYSAIGGGVETDNGGSIGMRASYPQPGNRSWYAKARNESDREGRMRVHVTCLRD